MFLLDTNVVSAFRKLNLNRPVAKWAAEIESGRLFLSAASIVEIERGLHRKKKKDPLQAAVIEQWFVELLVDYQSRILPITTPIAKRWGDLAGQLGNVDLDLAIAATALEHGLIVATRNIKHFKATGVATVDPFAE